MRPLFVFYAAAFDVERSVAMQWDFTGDQVVAGEVG